MECEQWREKLSAQLDGEDDPADRERLDAHLAGCAGCRRWLDAAARVNRLTRTGLAPDTPDLTTAVLAALPPARPRFPALVAALYVLLGCVGTIQLMLGLAQVGGGSTGAHSHAAAGLVATPGHLWHESAAWNVALGTAFLLVALRRTRPAGLMPILTAFVAMLLLLSANDLSAGRVAGDRLLSHGFVLLGYLAVIALSRVTTGPTGPRTAGRLARWRASFGDEGGRSAGVTPLRLVRRGSVASAPVTARQRTAA